jgi:hypothetical protein
MDRSPSPLSPTSQFRLSPSLAGPMSNSILPVDTTTPNFMPARAMRHRPPAVASPENASRSRYKDSHRTLSSWGRKRAGPHSGSSKMYVHCPFRIHAELYCQMSPLELSGCVVHFSEARHLRAHMRFCLRNYLRPCRNCGQKLCFVTAGDGRFSYSSGVCHRCGCLLQDMDTLAIQTQKALDEIPPRLHGGINGAFETIWQLLFPNQAVPDTDIWTCPGRLRCKGFMQQHQDSPGRSLPGVPSPPAMVRARKTGMEATSISDSQLPSLKSPGKCSSPTELGSALTLRGDAALLSDDDVLDQMCDNFDELGARIGQHKLREIVEILLSPEPEEPSFQEGNSRSSTEIAAEGPSQETAESDDNLANSVVDAYIQRFRIPCKSSLTDYLCYYDENPAKSKFTCRCCNFEITGSTDPHTLWYKRHQCSCLSSTMWHSSAPAKRSNVEKSSIPAVWTSTILHRIREYDACG